MTQTLSELRTEHARLVTKRREVERNHKRLNAEIARIERQQKLLRAKGNGRTSRSTRDLDPHIQAGPKNISLVREAFKDLGTATMARVSERAGQIAESVGVRPVGRGSLTWAIRALEKDGEIVPTGRRQGVSREYQLVKVRTRRETKLGPGE